MNPCDSSVATGSLHLVLETEAGQHSVADMVLPHAYFTPLGSILVSSCSGGSLLALPPLSSVIRAATSPLPSPQAAAHNQPMFHSFSSSSSSSTVAAIANSCVDANLHHPLFCTAAAPRGLYHDDANCSFLPFPSENYLPRSSSTHSLLLNHYTSESVDQPAPPPLQYSSSPSSSCEYVYFNAGLVRRVLSADDLQGTNALLESYSQEGSSAPGKVGRYSAEERKERIERYRSKRNQRNFHKKITYACRKTLADSRPRVRGRFARNGEAESEGMETAAGKSFNSYNVCGGNGGNWWSQIQVALATDDEDDRYYDGDVLVNFTDADDISLNILF